MHVPNPASLLHVPLCTGKCPCSFPFTYCTRGSCTSYSRCTTVDSPNRPWCIADTSSRAVLDPSTIEDFLDSLDDDDWEDFMEMDEEDWDQLMWSMFGSETGGCTTDGSLSRLEDPSESVEWVFC